MSNMAEDWLTQALRDASSKVEELPLWLRDDLAFKESRQPQESAECQTDETSPSLALG